eukprot:PhF_6_TR40556/c0_g1_i3/m.60806
MFHGDYDDDDDDDEPQGRVTVVSMVTEDDTTTPLQDRRRGDSTTSSMAMMMTSSATPNHPNHIFATPTTQTTPMVTTAATQHSREFIQSHLNLVASAVPALDPHRPAFDRLLQTLGGRVHEGGSLWELIRMGRGEDAHVVHQQQGLIDHIRSAGNTYRTPYERYCRRYGMVIRERCLMNHHHPQGQNGVVDARAALRISWECIPD